MANNPPIRHRTRQQGTAAVGSEVSQAAEQSSDSYEIGYGKPPAHTRFKPGRSGNPKGRPRGRKNFRTELLEELHEGIAVREGGRRRTVSKQRAMLKTLTAKALQGDARAATLIVNMVFRVLQQDDEPVDEGAVSAEDRAILEAYEERIRRNASAPLSDRTRKGGGRP